MSREDRKELWKELGIDYEKPIYDKETGEKYSSFGVNYIEKKNGIFAIGIIGDKYPNGMWVLADKYAN